MNRSLKHSISIVNSNDGLTLVEVMMTLLIFATVLAVINNVFFTTQALYSRTSQRADMQMSTRAGLGVFVSEIRAAGCDPTEAGIAGLRRATQDSVRFQSDLNADGAIQTVEPSEDVMYFFDAGREILFRDPGTGPQPMITNVTQFVLTYFDGNNVTIGPLPLDDATIPLVRSVGITITAETPRGGELQASARIGLRNLSN